MAKRVNHVQARQEIAELAARLIAEEGLGNYQRAKRKAAERLGYSGNTNLPDNLEIENCLIDYQRLFHADSQGEILNHRRRLALQAMRLLQPYTPRLVGPVLNGTATEFSPVSLHVFNDSPEEIGFYLERHAIPYHPTERQLRQPKGSQRYSCYEFLAEEVPIELIVFPHKELHHPPLSPVDGKPMRRADLRTLEALLQETQPRTAEV